MKTLIISCCKCLNDPKDMGQRLLKRLKRSYRKSSDTHFMEWVPDRMKRMMEAVKRYDRIIIINTSIDDEASGLSRVINLQFRSDLINVLTSGTSSHELALIRDDDSQEVLPEAYLVNLNVSSDDNDGELSMCRQRMTRMLASWAGRIKKLLM